MLKKTVDSIRKTELEASKLVEDAAVQVSEKRKMAHVQAKKNQEEAIAEAHVQANQALLEAKAKGELMLQAAQQEAVNEANALRESIAKKEAKAIRLVIEHLI